MGKKAKVDCSDKIPETYRYMQAGTEISENPGFIVAVDVAAVDLLGDKLLPYAQKTDLCIDHHGSNEHYAKFTFADANAAAACEVITEIVSILNVDIDKDIANCLYSGIATDTGCFRYSNTTSKTLLTAARLVGLGAESAKLNKLLFETVSKERLELEKMALESLEYHCSGNVALMVISSEMLKKSGATESETEGIPAIPARIAGVKAGITLREKEKGLYRISVRTSPEIDASKICSLLGGGGHLCAAGCRVEGTLKEVKSKILDAVRDNMNGYSAKDEAK
jgi:phosphoesterase RecJ-like protein